MENEKYKIIDTGEFKVLDLLPISRTGSAEAYLSCFDGNADYSSGFSINLYKKLGQTKGHECFKKFCDTFSIPCDSVRTGRLTHFTNVASYVSIKDDKNFPAGWNIYSEPDCPWLDGLVADDRSGNICLMVYAADCALSALYDPINRVIGVFHSAWKGSLIGIVGNTISKMIECGAKAENIIAVCCPLICKNCMEVGEDCAEQFIEAGYAKYIIQNEGQKPHIDLMGINKQQLLESGLLQKNIYCIDECSFHSTFVDTGKFMFNSLRRSKSMTGEPSNGQNALFLRLK